MVLRFSALGDVAMTAPVVRAYAQDYPEVTFTMVSVPKLAPLFTSIPNLHFEPVHTADYQGIVGIIRLYRRLYRLRPTHIVDLHQVLRTYILCVLFVLSCIPISTLKKGRRQRRQLTRLHNKQMQPLPSMISKYEDVFVKAGLAPLQVDHAPIIRKTSVEDPFCRIGIAPFAKHNPKQWPVDKMEALIEKLSQNGKYRLFLFGGGSTEIGILKGWEQRYAHTKTIAGSLTFAEELSLIGKLHLLVSMDSANMHFASFMGVPVISIWGGTHPFAGFYGWRQDPERAVSVDLACRPCSVFGSKPCWRGDLMCLQNISVEEVKQKIDHFFLP